MSTGAGQVMTQMEGVRGTPPLLASAGAGSRLLESALVALIAGTLYAFTIQSRAAHLDEFYHLLAGRSWEKDGSFRILDGVYLRARLFTMLVGETFDLTGRADLLAARIPSVLFAALSCGLLYHCLRGVANRWAAFSAAALLGLCGYTFDIAHFARFYALHAVLVLGAAISLHAAMRPRERYRTTLLVLSAICLVVAMHLQPVTVIAAIGLALWLLLGNLHLAWQAPVRTLALGGGALLAIVVLLQVPAVGDLLARFGRAERWAMATQDAPLYYLAEYLHQIPLLALLFPVAAWLACRRYGRTGTLGVIMVVVPLLLHSFAGMKAWRYAYYTYPFLCWTWGLAIGAVTERMRGGSALVPTLAGLGAMIVLTGSAPAYRQTVRILSDTRSDALTAPVPDGDWDKAAPALRALAAGGRTLVTSDDLRTLATIGRFDLFISHSRLGELEPPRDFTKDFRTGRPLVDTGAGMQAVIDCTPSGLIIISNKQWRTPMGVRPDVADLIERRLQPDARAPAGFRIYGWRHQPPRQSCPFAPPPHPMDDAA
ncbi:MAG: glycosyltransferase family 39 protein [Sphingobium sp.]